VHDEQAVQGYLASDGEHPNAKGHQAIATLTESVIENTLHI
jgi:lysophospholipase L1-like esterase